MIRTLIPFRTDKNLGAAYNAEMQALPDDGWACFVDHDAMFTTSYWYAQLEEAIAVKPLAGCFTAVTNRIASPWQKAAGAPVKDDIIEHRKFGEQLRSKRTLLDITCTKGFGGVMTLISKRAWSTTRGYGDGLFCCDHSIFFQLVSLGFRIYMIEGLYVYHVRATSSAMRTPPPPELTVANCPCRGKEQMPTERLYL